MKKDKKRKNILDKAKVVLLVPFLSFIFTRNVHGGVTIPMMYVAPQSPIEMASSVAQFFANILLIPSALIAVVYIIFKRRKIKKKWPKIVLIIFVSLTALLFVSSFVMDFLGSHFFGYY